MINREPHESVPAPSELEIQFEELDLPAEVSHELPGAGCAYNLQGLSTRGQCPECNAPIWVALAQRRIAGADPIWLSRVVSGANCVGWAGASLIAGTMITRLLIWLGAPEWIFGALAAGAITLAAMGCWLMTTPNPAKSKVPQHRDPAIRARWLLFLSLAGVAGAAAIRMFGYGSAATATAIVGIASPIGISGWLCLRDLSRLFETLARDVDCAFESGRARLYRRYLDVCGLLLAVCFAMGVAAGGAAFCIGLVPGTLLLGLTALILSLPVGISWSIESYEVLARKLRDAPDAYEIQDFYGGLRNADSS